MVARRWQLFTKLPARAVRETRSGPDRTGLDHVGGFDTRRFGLSLDPFDGFSSARCSAYPEPGDRRSPG